MMKTNLVLITMLLAFFALFLIKEIFFLKKEVRKLNKIVKHLLGKNEK